MKKQLFSDHPKAQIMKDFQEKQENQNKTN